MKPFVLVLAGILVLGRVMSQENNKMEITNWESEKLSGKVKSIKTSTYEAIEKFGEMVKGELEESRQLFFNEKGVLIKSIEPKDVTGAFYVMKYDNAGKLFRRDYFGTNGKLRGYEIIKYDSKGNRIAFNTYYPNGLLENNTTRKFNDKGLFLEEAVYYSGKLDSKKICKYDSRGNRIEESHYNADGSLDRKAEYQNVYDEKGLLIEVITHIEDIPEGNLEISRKLIVYDNNGKVVQIKDSTSRYGWMYISIKDFKGREVENSSIKPNGELREKYVKKYAEDDRLISEVKYKEGETTTIEISYNEIGQKVEEVEKEFFDNSIKRMYKSVYKYDKYGNAVEYVLYNIRNEVVDKTTWEYEFDAKYNWVKQIKKYRDYKNRNIGSHYDRIIERQIQYY